MVCITTEDAMRQPEACSYIEWVSVDVNGDNIQAHTVNAFCYIGILKYGLQNYVCKNN